MEGEDDLSMFNEFAGETSDTVRSVTPAATGVLTELIANKLKSQEEAEKLYQQLQKVSGRVEKIYTPVQDSEVVKVIRRRLFSRVEEGAMKKIIAEFMDYAEKEGIIQLRTDTRSGTYVITGLAKNKRRLSKKDWRR
jgi:ferredoxin-thioredoxin reductase catalytic subunit